MISTKGLHRAEKLVIDNSPAILAAFGVVGLFTTAVLTGMAGYKTAVILNEEDPFDDLHPIEKVKLVWPEYIPAVGLGVISSVCIIASNRVSNKRAAALAAAYSLSERTMLDYREKVLEKLGETKERKIRDEIAQDRVAKNPPKEGSVIITGNGDVLCYDTYSGRYFLSCAEKINRAVNELNHRLIHDMYASLNDFYNLLGLEPIDVGEEVGWTSLKLLNIQLSATVSDDSRPCLAITFDSSPVRNYHKFS